MESEDDEGYTQTISDVNNAELGWTSVIVSDSEYVYGSVHELMGISIFFSLLYFLALLLGYGDADLLMNRLSDGN